MFLVTLYTRPECSLCEEMKKALAEVAREFPFKLEEVDVSQSPDLEGRFGFEVPVLFLNGRKAAKYRITARELRKKLKQQQRRWPFPWRQKQ